MNHVKRLIFQTWPLVGKVPAVVRQSPDLWLQGYFAASCVSPTGFYNATLKWILWEVSVCVDSSQGTGWWPYSFSFQHGVYAVEFWVRMLLNSGVTQVLWLVLNLNCGSETQSPAEWRIPSWKLVEYSRDVSVHMQLWNSLAVFKIDKRGAQKRGKRVHWVIYGVFGNTLVLTGLQLCVQVGIHIRGLSVWSMSCGITTAGKVSWQTGPGHWMVLRTSRHSYINRIKTSNWGLLALACGRGVTKKTKKANVLWMVGELKLWVAEWSS